MSGTRRRAPADGPRGLDDVPVEARDCRWVWNHLHEPAPDTGEACKLRIPETILFGDGEPRAWLCSDRRGYVAKRPRAQCTVLGVRQGVLDAAQRSMRAAGAEGGGARPRGAPPGLGGSPSGAGALLGGAGAGAQPEPPPPPPYAACVRRTVKGGDVKGFLLSPTDYSEMMATGVGLASFFQMQSYIQPRAGPGHRVRVQLEVGQDGNTRAAAFALSYPPGVSPPAASRSIAISDSAEIPASSAVASAIGSRTLQGSAADAAARVVRHLEAVAHVQLVGLLADFCVDSSGKLWFLNAPTAFVRTRDVPLRSAAALATRDLVGARVALSARVDALLHRLVRRRVTPDSMPWCSGDWCGCGLTLPRRKRGAAPPPPRAAGGAAAVGADGGGGARSRPGSTRPTTTSASRPGTATLSQPVEVLHAVSEPEASNAPEPAAAGGGADGAGAPAAAAEGGVVPAEEGGATGAPGADAEASALTTATSATASTAAGAAAGTPSTAASASAVGGDGAAAGAAADEAAAEAEAEAEDAEELVTVPPPSMQVLVVHAETGEEWRQPGWRVPLKAVLLARLEAVLGAIVDDTTDDADTWAQALSARLPPRTYRQRLPLCEACTAFCAKADRRRRSLVSDNDPSLVSRVLAQPPAPPRPPPSMLASTARTDLLGGSSVVGGGPAGGKQPAGGGAAAARRATWGGAGRHGRRRSSTARSHRAGSADGAAERSAQPSYFSADERSPPSTRHGRGSTGELPRLASTQSRASRATSRMSTASRLELRAVEPQLPPVLGAGPRLSLTPLVVAGLLPMDVDWARAQRDAQSLIRPVPAAPPTQEHSAIRWPTLVAAKQLRPSLRQASTLPPVN